MSEGRAPISSSRIATGDIAHHTFALVRRGYDPDEVRSYLQSVSRSIGDFEEREREMQAAVADAEERAVHPVLDEATLTASLGQHSAQILRHAHEEAARIVAQAQDRAATLLRDTQSQVDDLQARAEASSAERVAEVELMVANAQHEAHSASERIVADAVAEGEALINRAKEEGRILLDQVQEARRRVLSDLAARRRTLGIHIEQLRAARDEMSASVHGVRDRVDTILAHLDRTDDAARTAAHAVGDHFRLHGAEAPHDQDTEAADAAEAAGVGTGGTATAGRDDAGTEAGSADDGTGAPPSMPTVDELFARIRAGSKAATLEAEATGALRADATGAGDALDGVTAPDAENAEDAEDAEDAEPGPDDALVARRDELLAPVTAKLGRSVKRALGDDQNRMLDRLRNDAGLPAEELLGPEDAHVEAFVAAAKGHLGEAFAAGTTFGGAEAAVDGSAAIEQSSAGLARAVVSMLRRQITEGAGDPGDRVGAAFREWRGERVERLVGDSATQAFSSGVTAAIGPGSVRWVVTSATGCSDCADNSLAGALGAGETFPTGHAHPPAHPGCRCLVAPVDV